MFFTVRSPSTSHEFPEGRTAVDRKRISGYCCTSRKSAERTWLSRVLSPVSMLAAWITASTDDRVGSGAISMVPENELKLPRTRLIIMCRAANWIREWVGSMLHFPGAGSSRRSVLAACGVLVDIPSSRSGTALCHRRQRTVEPFPELWFRRCPGLAGPHPTAVQDDE